MTLRLWIESCCRSWCEWDHSKRIAANEVLEGDAMDKHSGRPRSGSHWSRTPDSHVLLQSRWSRGIASLFPSVVMNSSSCLTSSAFGKLWTFQISDPITTIWSHISQSQSNRSCEMTSLGWALKGRPRRDPRRQMINSHPIFSWYVASKCDSSPMVIIFLRNIELYGFSSTAFWISWLHFSRLFSFTSYPNSLCRVLKVNIL